MDWAPLVMKYLVKLILWLFVLLTMRGVIHSPDNIVGLAFARRIPLVAGPSMVIVALSIVVVAMAWEETAFLRFFDTRTTVQSLYRDFGRNRPKTVVDLREMMQRWADEEEQERSRFPHRNNDNNGKRLNDRGGPSN